MRVTESAEHVRPRRPSPTAGAMGGGSRLGDVTVLRQSVQMAADSSRCKTESQSEVGCAQRAVLRYLLQNLVAGAALVGDRGLIQI